MFQEQRLQLHVKLVTFTYAHQRKISKLIVHVKLWTELYLTNTRAGV